MKTKTRLMKVASTSLLAIGMIGVTGASKNPNSMEDHGTIESVNVQQQTFTIKESKSKEPQVFTWNQDTRFVEHNHAWSKSKPVMADQLQPGETVKVRYQKENDQLVAKSIVISHANKAAASATPSSS